MSMNSGRSHTTVNANSSYITGFTALGALDVGSVPSRLEQAHCSVSGSTRAPADHHLYAESCCFCIKVGPVNNYNKHNNCRHLIPSINRSV